MKYFISFIFVCATLCSVAQTNFVKNGDFERYDTCPYESGQIIFCNGWQNCVIPDYTFGCEFFNACNTSLYVGCPDNGLFYQNPHSKNGMAGTQLFFDTPPPPPSDKPFNNREGLQSKLINKLNTGKTYCVSFWINLAEESGYAHNKIGAYLDDGSINSAVDSGGEEITSIKPQVYTNSIVKDTMNWVKIEGSFVAKGNETYITIGNFFPNDSVSTEVTNYWFTLPQYSYYLIDDVSVVAIDAKANAGVDRWVELGKSTQIGPVEDSTARGLDCKWYHKGKLIDSGNVIIVKASTIKYAVDTYVVVQNVCGNITRDTMLLRTVGLGMQAPLSLGEGQGVRYSLYPNPSKGMFTVALMDPSPQQAGYATSVGMTACVKIYDLLGREVHKSSFTNETTIQLNAAKGMYILELKDEAGNVQRERIVIDNTD